MLIELFAALACGPLDRLRGNPAHLFGRRIFDKLAYGAALAAALGYHNDPRILLTLTLLLALGMSPGWGGPMGAILGGVKMQPEVLEWWQFGPLTRDPWLALAARGLLWGLPVIPVALYLEAWPMLAFGPALAIAFVIGMWLGPKLRFIEPDDAWGRCEWVRGWAAGALLLAIGGVR